MEGTLIWSYSPKDYFEKPLQIPIEQCTLEINAGWITTTLELQPDNLDEEIKKVERQIAHIFRFTQLENLNPYELTLRQAPYKHPSGEIRIAKYSEWSNTASITLKAFPSVAEAAEKAKREQNLIKLAIKYGGRDETLEAILNFLHTARNDPENELIHLLDIREALSQRFGGDKNACAVLKITGGVTGNKWSDLGRLGNNKAIRQGRHRGTHYQQLRDATPEELGEARTIVYNMIRKYIDFLELQP
jgi:hypothetical protein